MNIEILQTQSNINKVAKLTIQPLAPLSMVSEIPGTYYKAEDIPDKIKLCGLFENILGWHFDKKDRDEISKDLIDFHKKRLKNKKYGIGKSNSGYQPLLFDFFEIGMIFKSETINYNDLWKRSFSRMDADVHPKGTPNIDYNRLRQKGWIKEEENRQESIKKEIKSLDSKIDKEKITELKEKIKKAPLLMFFEENKKAYPMYYTSPTIREYIDYLGANIQIQLKIDGRLFEKLVLALENCSTAYLGNSEGWVELKLEEI